jgi:hypothetical protein
MLDTEQLDIVSVCTYTVDVRMPQPASPARPPAPNCSPYVKLCCRCGCQSLESDGLSSAIEVVVPLADIAWLLLPPLLLLLLLLLLPLFW